MKKAKPKDKTFLNTNEKLVKMFEDQIPEDRQQVLRDIDSIMCNMLEVEPNDLPWINPNKHEEKWEILMNKLAKYAYCRLFSQNQLLFLERPLRSIK